MGALLDAVPAGGADHTEHHRDLATAIEAVPAAYQPLDSDLTAIAALTTTAYGRGLLSLANQAALQAEAGGSALVAGVDYPTSATVTLSSADILDLHNTPITLVAAPGAGKVIAAHKAVAFYTFGTAAYVYTGDPEYMLLGGSFIGELGAMLTGTESTFAWVTPTVNPVSTSGVENQSVTVANGSATTTGDGTLTVTVWYTVEDVPA